MNRKKQKHIPRLPSKPYDLHVKLPADLGAAIDAEIRMRHQNQGSKPTTSQILEERLRKAYDMPPSIDP